MSARKRHTSALDFMRSFIVGERTGGLAEIYGPGFHDMVARLIKRGWIEQTRDGGYKWGTFRQVLQRRNSLRSTPKGRRAVYRADRHAEPHIRPHWYGESGGWGSPSTMNYYHQRRLERLAKVSAKAIDLHGSRRK